MPHNPTKPGLPGTPPDKESRVVYCMELMRELRWKRGVTDKQLAAQWGLELMSIRQYSAEAWRRVKAEVVDPDATPAKICAALERVIDEASDKGLAGHRSIIEAGKTWAAIAGVGAPTRIEIGALAQMTDEELERRKLEVIARLSATNGAPPPDHERPLELSEAKMEST